jgi:hypothetical protein
MNEIFENPEDEVTFELDAMYETYPALKLAPPEEREFTERMWRGASKELGRVATWNEYVDYRERQGHPFNGDVRLDT